jgi:hypothetical protein
LLPYHVFGIERAFAFEWWIDFLALPALGIYALALLLGIRTLTAVLIAMIVVLSPVVQWWTVPGTGTTIGYACLGGAALIAAMRVHSAASRIALAAIAGWLGACLVLVLYPSWVVPMALVAGTTAATAIAVSYPSSSGRRAWWLRLLGLLGVVGAVSGVLILAFALAHRSGLDAIANSIYPGRRRSSGGTGDLPIVFGAPFDIVESTRSSVLVFVNGLNQSEAAAGLFTLFAIAAAVIADPTRSLWKPWSKRAALLGVLGVGLAFLAWYLLPIPAGVGRLVLFDRVRPDRLLLPLAVVGALAIGLFVDVHLPPGRRLHRRALIAGTAAFAVPTVWAGWRLRIDGHLVAHWQVLLLAAAATVGVGLALSGRHAGLLLVVALFAVNAATVNPLQRGLAVLVDNPAAQLGRELRARPGTGAALVLSADPGKDQSVLSGLTASGIALVSGVSGYPNATAWRVLDPEGSSRRAWDRYSIALFTPGAAGSKPAMAFTPPAALVVSVDPCDPRLAKLGIRTIVSDQELTRPCLVEIDRRIRQGPTLYAYRIERPARS